MKIEKLKNYEGNEIEFKKYNEILKKDFKGTILYYDNRVKKYSGNIVNDLYEGRGILYNVSGDIIYDGFFKKGKYEGFGKKYENTLLKYEGFFSNDKYEGKGNLYYNNVKIYEGHFNEGKYHGIGIKFNNNGKKARKLFFNDGFENSYGILYDNNVEIYSGELSYNRPKDGKNITIFNDDGNKIYKGDFSNFEYNGKGILFFNDNEEIYFEGIFKNDECKDGKLYDLEGNITYQGKFKDGKPIKGKNIKLYDLNKNIIYHGDFEDGKYSGFGKIYRMNNIYYKGNFEKGEIKGKGIKYYKNGNKHIEGNFDIKNCGEAFDFNFKENLVEGLLFASNGDYILTTKLKDFIPKNGNNKKILFISDKCLLFDDDIYNNKYKGNGKLYERERGEYFLKYEGYFLNGDIHGKGVKFYKNGGKKFEGYFELNNLFEGIYYNPKGNIIFQGKIKNDFFYDSDILGIYNDDGSLIYHGQIEKDEKNFDNYQIFKDIILCRDKILNNYYINMGLKKTKGQISFISSNHSGRTALIKRLIKNEFYSELSHSYLPEFNVYNYIYNNNEYSLLIWNTHGAYYKFKNLIKLHYKNDNISIYVVDLSNDEIDEEIISDIYENVEKNNKFIYLVISKIDINKVNLRKLESSRNSAKKLILEGTIYRYFELSAKNGEGFDEFKKCLKFDFDLSLKLEMSENKSFNTLDKNQNINKEDNFIHSIKKLNKYLHY